MLVDLEPGSEPGSHHSNVCIIGGGIAGLTLAESLSKTGLHVNLLEAGGLHHEARYQELNHVENTGRPHAGSSHGRFRVLGGSSSRWGGQILPLTADVLQPPAEFEMPKWPLQLAEIEPYFATVEALMGVNHLPFSGDLLDCFRQRRPLIPSDVSVRFSKWAPHRNRNLARTLGQACIESSKVCVFLHANVTKLKLRENGSSVDSALVRTMNGAVHVFEADLFVICAGTIETSRLLLASNDACGSGLANCRDQVGRYFHDHISIHAARLPLATRTAVLRHFTPRINKGTVHSPKLEASPALRRRKKLLAVMAHFPIEEPESTGLHSIRALLRKMQAGRLDSSARKAMLRLPGHSLELSSMLWTAYARKKRPLSKEASIALQIDCEQRPQASSRISLSAARDALGARLAQVDWRISEDERRTVQNFARTMARVFKEGGWGDPHWNEALFREDDSWLNLSSDTFHMMGGTRMGTDPADSVVDENLCVHGVPNLYVASCSVFPSGGSSNPTFTLMALTLRLAGRIKALPLPKT